MASAFRVFHSLDETGSDFGPCVLSIGNFDGLHIAHRRLLRRVVQVANTHGWTPSVLTFHPHPARIVAPERAPRLLTSPDQRAALMEEEGIRQVLVLPFNLELSRLTPEQFVRSVLVARLKAKAVVVGDNFRFGNRHAGDVRTLADLGRQFGFLTEVVPGVSLRRRIVSSSEIRRLVEGGKVPLAARLLGRPFSLEGAVIAGRGVGSKQTVPTLNLEPVSEVWPANGVYATRTTDLDDGRTWESATNTGSRPTLDGGAASIETFLLGGLTGRAPSRIRVEFLWRLRDERKFDNPASLKQQIFRDVARTEAYFRRLRRWRRPGA